MKELWQNNNKTEVKTKYTVCMRACLISKVWPSLSYNNTFVSTHGFTSGILQSKYILIKHFSVSTWSNSQLMVPIIKEFIP